MSFNLDLGVMTILIFPRKMRHRKPPNPPDMLLHYDLWQISCTHGLIQAVGPGQHGSRPPEQGGYPKGQRDNWAGSEDDCAK